MINPNEPYCSIYNEVTSSTRATKLKGSEPVIVDYVALDAKNKKHPQKVMNVILSGLYLLYEIDDKGFFLVFFLFFIYNNYPQQRTQRERERERRIYLKGILLTQRSQESREENVEETPKIPAQVVH